MTAPSPQAAPGTGAVSLRKQARTWHRWIGLAVGLAMIIWVVSGIVMITPGSASGWRMPHQAPPHTAYLLSPAQAIAAASGAPDANVVLKPFGDQPMLQVQHGGGRYTMIHAVTGAQLSVTRETAAWLASGDSTNASRIIEVTEYSSDYPAGALPVWRLPLDQAGWFVEVNPADAGVTLSTSAQRRRAYIFSLHTFLPLRGIIGQRLTHWLLWGLSFLSLVTVLTGYWLFLPRRKTRRSAS